MSSNFYKDVTHVVYLSSNTAKSHCDDCKFSFNSNSDALDARINHYLKDHQYRILHIGTESENSLTGNPWHNTVAVLGK
ncbi:TPA: hypothetical protein ACJ6XF_003052 [Legionella pneumophila]